MNATPLVVQHKRDGGVHGGATQRKTSNAERFNE
jgi:hypothetical protein